MADPSDTTFPYAAWNATRHANLRYLLQSLYPVVGKSTEAALPAPVYLRTLNPNGYGQDWYSRWTTADGIPSNTMDHSVVGGGSFWKPTDAGMAAAKVSQENWYVVRYIARQIEGRELPAATRMALSVNSQLKRLSPTWKGAIIDLSEIPLDRAITLLDGAMPVGTGR